METVLPAAGTLTRFIVIRTIFYYGQGYAHHNDAGSVRLGEASAFSTLAKIEAERATINDKYVNLRFCASNKYWQKNANDDFIVAVSNKPEEDTTKSSCTLFEAVKFDFDNGWFYLTHVQSGGRLFIDSTTMAFYVKKNPTVDQERSYLIFQDWDTLVKLPEHVAFKGDNGKYLQAFLNNNNYLQFKGDDPNDVLSGNTVSMMDDGHVRIKSDHWEKFWRRNPNWIWADSTDTTANNKDTLFWPVKIDDTTIALRNEGNNNFCKRLIYDGMENCLNASAESIVNEAKLKVQELVMDRKIYSVRYRMEDARIYGETPFLAGTTTATNEGGEEMGIAVEVSYENQSSYSFSSSLSITAGVTNTIQAGIPLIAGDSIEISFQINTTMEWNNTTTTTTSVKATGSVPVPPRSVASVSYVGTMGTCDVPFSYTRQDRSTIDGSVTETDEIDGVYTGVNCYNFSFVVEKTHPLS